MANEKRKRKPHSISAKPGASPGTITVNPDAHQPLINVIAYGPDNYVEQIVKTVEDIRQFLGKWRVLWVNIDGLGNAETITAIGEMFNLHRLALEDVVEIPQRSKTEQYGEHLFMVTQMTYAKEKIETEQLSLFVGKDFVVAFQERPGDCLDGVRNRIRKAKGRIRNAGADYLAYAILDAVIDNYFPVLEDFGDKNEDMLELVIRNPDSKTISKINTAKHDLLSIRRAVWPMREAVNALLREDLDAITRETQIYLRDCYDHITQIIDIIETYRELMSGLLDAYMSSLSNKMNEVMKVLTIIATIFIPLTFIVGIYGMNFNTKRSPLNMPELEWYWGYPAVLLIMATVAIGMLLFFRKKGWLGSTTQKETRKKKDK